MDVLFIVSTPEGGRVLAPLANACRRRGANWGCFFTNDGVAALGDPGVQKILHCTDSAVACEHSWARFHGEAPCPVTLGSQTNNSAMLGQAARVIGL
jgi:hypothetical protein